MATKLQLHSDAHLEQRLAELHHAVETWATSRDLWEYSEFQTWLDRVGGEPESPTVVTVLVSDGDLLRAIEDDAETFDQFDTIIRGLGFYHEQWDGASLYLHARDDALAASYDSYFRWKWICSLLEPDFADIHEEIYAHFVERPDDLHRLHWRDFEKLLARIFANQGFETELGPGSNDGGADVRLLQRDPLGDLLTLVQAKKYAPHHKVGYSAVAELNGAADFHRAQRTILVTTSSYQPKAREFSARGTVPMELKTSDDVIEWCRQANDGVISDKSTLVSRANVEKILTEIGQRADRRILHAYSGLRTTRNSFALLLKETRHAALLMSLPHLAVSADSYGQFGTEIPRLGEEALQMHAGETVWRARRTVDGGRARYWDGRNLFTTWDGRPRDFDWRD